MFGPFLEQKIGGKKFLGLYFATGIAGNAGYFVYAYVLGNPAIPAVGASGAIYGVLGALAVLEPNLTVFAAPFFLPLPLWLAAIGWVLTEFAFLGAPDLVGRAAHLAGLFLGVACALFLRSKSVQALEQWD